MYDNIVSTVALFAKILRKNGIQLGGIWEGVLNLHMYMYIKYPSLPPSKWLVGWLEGGKLNSTPKQ